MDHWAMVRNSKSTQEEADTHLLLHASHAAVEGYASVVITAEDAEALVLSFSFSKIFCPFF